MKLDLGTIKRGENYNTYLEFTVDVENIDYYGDVLEVVKPVYIKGNLYSMAEKMFLSCEIKVQLKVHCGRCLKPFNYLLETNINVELVEEDAQINEDELKDIIIYYDNVIDFDSIIREYVIASLPMKFICNEKCKGLCKFCGINLNNQSCKCNIVNDDEIDPRLAKLKNLLQQD